MRRYQAAVPETLRSLSVSLGRTFGSVQTKVPLTNRNSYPYLTLTLTLALTLALTLKVDTALLPGWNVLVYESPSELARFVDRRF